MRKPKILLFDLDGTLLRNDKTLSEYTLKILSKCKECGYLIGISTSRGEQNCLGFLREMKPDSSMWSMPCSCIRNRCFWRWLCRYRYVKDMRYWCSDGKCSTRGQRYCWWYCTFKWGGWRSRLFGKVDYLRYTFLWKTSFDIESESQPTCFMTHWCLSQKGGL